MSAIDAGDDPNLQEELGDLYLLVTMIGWMKEQAGAFSVQSTLEGICEKLVRRHPHVFGTDRLDGSEQVIARWDAIKAEEKEKAGAERSTLDGIALSLPPLERALELQKKAAKVGFDWPAAEPVWDKIAEELRELRSAVRGTDARRIEDEVGDLVFSVVNLARALHVDPSVAVQGTNRKFERRFREIERLLAAEGKTPREAGLRRMDELWNQVKASEPSEGDRGARNASK